MDDPFHLQRFVDAQQPLYNRVLDELSAARKRSHWMWFIFPQVAGLGYSEMAKHYAITGLYEARAYLAHPVLGFRLRQCTQLVLDAPSVTAHGIFGDPDDMKFRSCMTLFAEAAPDENMFRDCLGKYFDGVPDKATLDRL